MSQKVNIAFYCSSLSWGGLELNFFKRMKWMKERGHGVHVYCVQDSPLHKHALKEFEHVRIVSRNSKGYSPMAAKRLSKLFQQDDIQFIWCTDKRDISILGSAKNFTRKKIKLLYQQQMRFGVSKRDPWHTWIFKKIDHWIAPLNYLVDELKEMSKYPLERVSVIPLGMDVEAFQNSLPKREKAREYFNLKAGDIVVGMIGRIDYAKSSRFVMDVMGEIIEERPEVKMLMVGNKTENEGEVYYNDILSELEKYRDSKSIQLYPFMSEVGYFFQAIDIFVMASKNETFGMVTVEAMLAGKKICGTNAAGTKELLAEEQRGYYFNWMDAHSLKVAVKKVLDNPEEAEQKAEAAKKYASAIISHHTELEQIEKLMLMS